jgi:ABC-type Fe3+/spermidine/putrescine transport system ATPase subunit
MNGLSVKNLHIAFPDYEISSEDFSVALGSFLTVEAPSGFGKTTVLRALMGFQKLSAGTLYLNGRDLTALPAHARNFGVVFQDHLLFPHLNAWENAVFGLSLRKALDDGAILRAKDAFSRLGLQDRMHAPIQELSGGERQRVAILRATLFDPECLILDEPLKGLDQESTAKVVTYLKEHVSIKNIPAVWVSHQGADVFGGARIVGTEQSRQRHFAFTP